MQPEPAAGIGGQQPDQQAAPATLTGDELPGALDSALRSLAAMLELGAGSAATVLELAAGPVRLRVDFGRAHPAPLQIEPGQPTPASTQPASTQPASTAPAVAEPAGPAGPPATLVTAPLVGVFYRAPKPGAAVFCAPGDQVERDQQLAIVEAMKMMNEIVAPVSGVVTEVFAEEGQLVEYGQPLFAVAAA